MAGQGEPVDVRAPDAMMPSIPSSTARRASSGCRIPFSTIGTFVRSRRNGRSSQVREGREDLDEPLHRGPIRQRSNAARFARMVAPVPAPPATYAKASGDIASRARSSSTVASVGTRGRTPLTPRT
jgi:hypothetical protein